jgi:hypothetical protein
MKHNAVELRRQEFHVLERELNYRDLTIILINFDHINFRKKITI